MIVCVCHRVSDRAIAAAVDDGCRALSGAAAHSPIAISIAAAAA